MVANVAFGQAKAGRTDLVAYYYPWYDAGDWTRHPYVGTPTLGLYGTDDPTVAKKHITLCNEAGIDVLCASWWGEGTLTDRHLRAGLLAAPNAAEIRFCILYESPKLDRLDGERDTRIDFSQPEVMRQMIEDMRYLAATYLGRDNYYRIEDRPVVVLYLTRVYANFTAEHIKQLREAAGVELFLIGDEVYYGGQRSPDTARHGKRIFDAVTAYNMHTDPLIEDGEPTLDYMRREVWPVYRTWAESDDTWLMPNIMPSYKDFREHDTLLGEPAQFEQMLHEAEQIAAIDLAAQRRVIFITSFNEWWEGSTIEPAEEYGTGYLDAIRRWRQAPAAAE